MSSVYEKPLRGVAKYSSGKVDMEVDPKPHRLVQMLYQSILEKLAIMKGSIERQDQVSKSQLNTKLQLLFIELRKSINYELGGEISVNLDNLYEYCARLVAQAYAGNDKAKLDEVSALIEIIKDSWDKIEDVAKEVFAELEKNEGVLVSLGKKEDETEEEQEKQQNKDKESDKTAE